MIFPFWTELLPFWTGKGIVISSGMSFEKNPLAPPSLSLWTIVFDCLKINNNVGSELKFLVFVSVAIKQKSQTKLFEAVKIKK